MVKHFGTRQYHSWIMPGGVDGCCSCENTSLIFLLQISLWTPSYTSVHDGAFYIILYVVKRTKIKRTPPDYFTHQSVYHYPNPADLRALEPPKLDLFNIWTRHSPPRASTPVASDLTRDKEYEGWLIVDSEWSLHHSFVLIFWQAKREHTAHVSTASQTKEIFRLQLHPSLSSRVFCTCGDLSSSTIDPATRGTRRSKHLLSTKWSSNPCQANPKMWRNL